MKFRGTQLFLSAVLLFSLEFAGSALAQVGQPDEGGRRMNKMQMRMDPVARLNQALESAGSEPLSDSQEQELTTLANNFRAARKQGMSDPELQNAKTMLEEAILSRNEDQINRAADAVADQVTMRTRTMIRDLARFEIQVLSILTEDQVNALRTQYGNSGLIRTLGSLAGGPFSRGRMGGSRGGWRQ